MAAAHHAIDDPLGTLDRLEDPGCRIALTVRRHGAEMIGLTKSEADRSSGFLYRDGQTAPPSSGWANHATVMGYFLHRLVGERSLYRGREIRGGNHGFIRTFPFDAPAFDPAAASLTYTIPSDRIPPDAYPLRVSLALEYALRDDAVHVTFRFRNEEPDTEAHLSFGLHPGFAISDIHTAEILFPPGRYSRLMAPGNFLDGTRESFDFAGGPMPYAKEHLEGSYLVDLADVPDRRFVLRDLALSREVHLDFSQAPFFTLWSDAPDMICLEPCWGLPDSRPQKPFELKDGIQRIPPGGNLVAAFSIRPVLLPPQ